MRIATWNVNSLKARLPRVEEFLGYAEVDVLCLQETKLADKNWPALTFQELGYESVHYGQGQWNGVAILSRVGISDPSNGFGDAHVDPYEGDARVLAATCGGMRVTSVYVPNGREVGTEFYDRKLEWFSSLYDWVNAQYSPGDPLVITGDFNVAPEDRDSYDPVGLAGTIHHTPQEREHFNALLQLGLADSFRLFEQPPKSYSWWDYRMLGYQKNRGLRIDHVLVSQPLVPRVKSCVIDRVPHKWEKPSDHAPVILELEP